jgi:anaerobic ribonucleoside-triphosphate reductase activating protein
MILRINTFIPVSETNGPGKRFAIWTQGCLKGCIGCFNPLLQDPMGGYSIAVNHLFEIIKQNASIEGISVSGGEPFLQSIQLQKLLKKLKTRTGLSTLVFTGLTIDEVFSKQNAKKCLDFIDVLVAGPYIHKLRNTRSLVSSANQRIHLISGRYSIGDFNLPESEIIITRDGKTIITGIDPLRLGNGETGKNRKI